MDALPEIAIRLAGGLLRAAFEFLAEQVFGRLLVAIWGRFERLARWIAPHEFFVIPISILLLLAAGGLLFVIVVKIVQWAML